MDVNQFAVYQLKNISQTRQIRFRSYEVLKRNGFQVCYGNYEEVYIGRMQHGDTPESIRRRLKQKVPNNFLGHSISVSDVLVLNQKGEVTAYYVEKEGVRIITEFIGNGTSGTLLNINTTNYHIQGKAGSWLVIDSIIIEDKKYFLMEHEKYGSNAAYVVLDEVGVVVVDNNCNGFDNYTKQQIREYIQPQKQILTIPPASAERCLIKNCQKYMENKQYLHNTSMGAEKSHNMIGRIPNNTVFKIERVSVIAKLHQKKIEISQRINKSMS